MAKATIHIEGETIDIDIPEGKTILDAMMDEGLDPPFSCTAGACSTCVAKIVKGTVEMEVCHALDEDEVEEGYILTCQSHVTSDEIEVKYEDQ